MVVNFKDAVGNIRIGLLFQKMNKNIALENDVLETQRELIYIYICWSLTSNRQTGTSLIGMSWKLTKYPQLLYGKPFLTPSRRWDTKLLMSNSQFSTCEFCNTLTPFILIIHGLNCFPERNWKIRKIAKPLAA